MNRRLGVNLSWYCALGFGNFIECTRSPPCWAPTQHNPSSVYLIKLYHRANLRGV
uniref:Uncharacterized protein n=1 Tax=Anguilla anguilla TaxID=7936 RepID=A0A0E9W9M0_ANGAN